MFIFVCVFCSVSRKRPADDEELLMTPSKRIKKLELTTPGKNGIVYFMHYRSIKIFADTLWCKKTKTACGYIGPIHRFE